MENPFISVDVSGSYNFTFTDNTCGNDTTVTIYFADSVFVDLPATTFCIGDEVTLNAYSDVTEATYLWSNGSTNSSIDISKEGQYSVVVTGLCNTAADTINAVAEICDIIPHNVITPNGDGQNDVLYFTRLERYPNSKLLVFNRWGNKVYENDNYQNDWSPTDLSDGTYFYILSPGEGAVPAETISQTFTILK